METSDLINLFGFIVTGIGLLYLAFFKSYLKEKGKLDALKDDIQFLTEKVEAVKNEFVKEQETLKADLQRVISNEVEYRREERGIIIDFHTVMSQWEFSILEITPNIYDRNNIELLVNDIEGIDHFYAKAGVALNKVRLLVEDEELIKSAGNFHLATLNFHYWAKIEFIKLKHILKSEKDLVNEVLVLMKRWKENEEEIKKMGKKEKELQSEARILIDKYFENRNDEVQKIYVQSSGFTAMVKGYLKS